MPHRRELSSTRTILAVVLGILPFVMGNSAVANAGAPVVTTIAGNGEYGINDGQGSHASFLSPAGVAVDRVGNIFVSDEAAQRIRRISPAGEVKTVAGTGAIGELGFSVRGGYQDGPALSARFNHPVGVAFGPDGALYIADSKNSCIRKLQNGVVSTVVGKAGDSSSTDGDAATARLVLPRSLSFDRTGTLWIGDYTGGLRRLDRDGHLSTIPLSVNGAPYTLNQIISVSASPDSDDPIVVIALPRTILIYHTTIKTFDAQGEDRAEGTRAFGNANQVIALGNHEVLFSDGVSNNIRYFRIRVPLFADANSEVVAGSWDERGYMGAGHTDGSLADARFYSPRGIAVRGQHLIVADSGNRLIRDVSLPRFRLPEAGLSTDFPYDSNHYEIVYIGPSVTFWDSDGVPSICLTLEGRLDASHIIPKPVRCHTIRIDAGPVPVVEDYIANFLAEKKVDLYIMPTGPGSTTAGSFGPSLTNLLSKLTFKGKFMVVWEPDSIVFSADESMLSRQEYPPQFDSFPEEVIGYVKAYQALNAKELLGRGILVYDPLDALLRYEHTPYHLPLYGTEDSHTNPRGSVFLANGIADYLISRKLVP